MPWKETCVEVLRESLVLSMLSREADVAALCRRAGVSRKTAYRWLERYREDGRGGLVDRSRARLTQEHAVCPAVQAAILAARAQHPTWGAKKLLPYLEGREPELSLPSLSTANEILRRAGLTQPQRPRRRHGRSSALATPEHANHTWTTDFKGQFRLGDGLLCYPLTVVDAFSRFVLCVDAKGSIHQHGVMASFRRLFHEHGLPERIRSDNGTPFAGSGLGRLSRLNVWFMGLGVVVERITPGRPGENGSHERMHRTLKAETTRPPGATMRRQQLCFNRFRAEYNHERPHEGIWQRTPDSLYAPSPRPYLGDAVDEDVYPGHWERRRVRTDGSIRWRGRKLFISAPLAGRLMGMLEIDEGLWQLHYQGVLIGLLDGRGREVEVRDAMPRVPAEPEEDDS